MYYYSHITFINLRIIYQEDKHPTIFPYEHNLHLKAVRHPHTSNTPVVGFLYANRAIRYIVPDSSMAASWKAVRTFPKPKGGRNDTALRSRPGRSKTTGGELCGRSSMQP